MWTSFSSECSFSTFITVYQQVSLSYIPLCAEDLIIFCKYRMKPKAKQVYIRIHAHFFLHQARHNQFDLILVNHI